MSKRSIELYLRDILDAIDKIEKYTSSVDFEMFSKNPMMIDAVLMNIAIIGEAAKKVPDEIKESYPEIPWKEISGMRDRIIHDYFGIDIEIVWQTVIKDIPYLKNTIKQIYKKNCSIEKDKASH